MTTGELIELAGGVPALHPERKGQLNISKLKNWIEKNGGLPTYINSVATAILRKNPSWSISRVIATAVNWAKKTCDTGKAFGGRVSVSTAVQAAACRAVQEWERKKAATSIEFDDVILSLSTEDDVLLQEEYYKANLRKMYRDSETAIPDLLYMSDEMYFRFMESEDDKPVELSWSFDNDEEVNNVVSDIDTFLQVMELSASAQSAVRLPFNMSTMQEAGDGKWTKEILRVGELIVDKTGRKFKFTSDFLKDLYRNFKEGPLDYVPLLYTDANNNHTNTGNAHNYAGKVTELSLDDDSNPSKLYGTFDLTEPAEAMIKHNPQYGVSITAHPNYVDAPRGVYYGPTLLNVAGTHYPKFKQQDEWSKVTVMASDENTRDFDVIDLSMEQYETEGGINMAGENNQAPLELSSEQMTQLLSSDAVTSAIQAAVKEATKDKDEEIVRLSNEVNTIQNSTYETVVNAALSTYNAGDEGVPPVVIDYARALMLSFGADEQNETIELSVGDETKQLNKVALVTGMLDEIKGFVDLSKEKGSGEEETVELSQEQRSDAVNFLVGLANSDMAKS